MQCHPPIYLPNGAARVLVCVDAREYGELQGRWYTPYQPEPTSFYNVIGLLAGLEGFYNAIAFPQSAVALRCLGSRTRHEAKGISRREMTRYMSDEKVTAERGEKATFVVQVQFRQNATWQGTVTWAEKNQTSHFRSALELLKMMDETISGQAEAEDKQQAAW